MANVSSSTGMMRIDTSRMTEYLYADQPKRTFMQKVGNFFGKALTVLGPIGAAVTSCLGFPAVGAGIYGASNLAAKWTANSEAKRAGEMQQWQQEHANMPVTIPGFYEQPSAVDSQLDFIAPSEFQGKIDSTLLNRGEAESGMIENFNIY